MREIVLDTETTGFDPTEGDRIVEIGAVELWNHVPTGEVFHVYINPQRPMPQAAFEVHGLGDDFLRDKPVFAQVADAFLAFVRSDKLVIHNAAFDMRFLNHELGQAGLPQLAPDRAIDTLDMARRKFPGSPASLDALCRRFGIDNSAREKHGALLDSEILAEVYLQLIGGHQPGLSLQQVVRSPADTVRATQTHGAPRLGPRKAALAPRLTPAEAEAHAAFVAELGPDSVWAKLAGQS